MTVDELEVLITANANDFKKEISKVNSNISSLSKSASKSGSSLTGSFLKANVFAKLLGTAVKVVANNLGDAVSRLDTLNNYTNVMSNLGVDAQDAEDSIQRLSDKLTGLPTTLDSAVSSVQRFTSANGNVKASTDMFLALNNALLAGGAPLETQKQALEQLTQAYSRGKPELEEWKSAMTVMPAQLKQVAQYMGFASADALGESLRSGTTSMNEFMIAMTQLNTQGANGFQSFEQQALNSTNGVATSMSNVKTAFVRGLTEIMNAIGQSNIAGFFQGIASAINAVVPYITGFVKAVVWAVSSIASLFGGGKTKKEADSVSTSLGNIGSAGSSAGTSASKGLDKATGSAKKLNKELKGLAGFDEMNVLSDKTSDSGGSGGSGGSGSGTGGGIGSIGEWNTSDWNLGETSSKADEVANAIIASFQKVADFINTIDFSGIMGHISSIGNSLTSIFSSSTVTSSVQNWATTLINGLSNIAKNVVIVGVNIAEGLLGSIDLYLQENGSRISDAIASNFNNASTRITLLSDVSNLFAQLSEIFKGEVAQQIGADIINIFMTPFMTIGTLLDSFFTDLMSVIITPFTENAGLLQEAITNFLNPVQTIFDTLSSAVTTISDSLLGLYTEHISPLLESIKNGLSDTFGKFLEVYNEYIQPFVENVANRFKEMWDSHLKPLWDNLTELAGSIIDGIKQIWEQWLKPLIDWIIQNIVPVIVPIIDTISSVVSSVFNVIVDVISTIIDVLKGIIDFVVSVFTGDWQGAWDAIKGIFSSIWEGIKKIVTTVVNGIKDFISSAWNAIKTIIDKVMNGIKSIIDKIWNGIWNVIKGVVNSILGGIESFANGIINGINWVIKALNNLHFDVPDWVPGLGGKSLGFNIPTLNTISLPRLAEGGIVDKATIAMVGEAGKEAVIPLERNTGWIDKLANKLADKIGGNKDVPIQLTVQLGEETIFNKFIDYTRSKAFETNGEVFGL